MFFQRSLLLVTISIVAIEGKLDACRQTFGTHTYDLNQLSEITLLGTDASFQYALTPCGLVPVEKCGTSSTPFENGMTSCQERMSPPKFESAMGFLNGYGKTPDLEFIENPQGPGTGVVMTMRNAKCNFAERLVKVTFICDETVTVPSTMDVVEKPTCAFTITVRAKQACPLTKGTGSLSGGAIFVIIVVVVAVVYLIGGIAYNRVKRHQTGLHLLPNTDFWVSIFGLFVQGCRSSWCFIRSCGQNTAKSNSYQSV